jgi:hypothetical protein
VGFGNRPALVDADLDGLGPVADDGVDAVHDPDACSSASRTGSITSRSVPP